MDNIKDDKYYISKILEDLSFMIFILQSSGELTPELYVCNILLNTLNELKRSLNAL